MQQDLAEEQQARLWGALNCRNLALGRGRLIPLINPSCNGCDDGVALPPRMYAGVLRLACS
jgi:hypothetical protein